MTQSPILQLPTTSDAPCPPLVDIMGRYRVGEVEHRIAGHSHSSDFGAFSGSSNDENTTVDQPVLGGLYYRRAPIGAGACGQVWEVDHLGNGQKFAAKVVRTDGMNAVQRQYAISEAALLSACDSPFVVKCVDQFVDPTTAVTVMELVQGVDLADHIRLSPPQARSEQRACILSAQLLLAVHHIHSRDILHRDLKSRNVFLCTSGLLKVGDFGLSSKKENVPLGENKRSGSPAMRHRQCLIDAATVGTPTYMAPELWNTTNPQYSTASDMFSVGVIMYELITGRNPFNRNRLADIVTSIFHQRRPDVRQEAPGTSDELAELIMSMLALVPAQRPTPMEALQSQVMRQALITLGSVLPQDISIDPTVAKAALREVQSALAERSRVSETMMESPVEKWNPAESADAMQGCWKRRVLTLTADAMYLRLPSGVAAAQGSLSAVKIPLAFVQRIHFFDASDSRCFEVTVSLQANTPCTYRFRVETDALLRQWAEACQRQQQATSAA